MKTLNLARKKPVFSFTDLALSENLLFSLSVYIIRCPIISIQMKATPPLTIAVFMILLCMTAFSKIDNSTSTQFADFILLMQNTEDGLKLKCERGCAWKELSFSLRNDQFQTIDQYGMSSLDRTESSTQDHDLSSFLINIRKTENGIDLEGREGTNWRKLSFHCPNKKCHQYIDRDGMK